MKQAKDNHNILIAKFLSFRKKKTFELKHNLSAKICDVVIDAIWSLGHNFILIWNWF